jgi:branched-chain amino acid transport system substrate-binding protein
MNPDAEHHITVGITASLTGRYAVQGSQSLAGAQAWVDDTNRSGGIWVDEVSARIPVRLIFYDDESNANRCAELTERLIVRDGVDILIGPYSSGLALKAASVAEKHWRVMWNQGGASELANSQGFAWVVSILTPDSRYFYGVIDYYLSLHPASKSVAIVHSTAGMFPKEVASGAESYCKQRGFDSIKTYPYIRRAEDFGPIIEQLQESQPGLILGVGRIADDIRFARQLAASGLKANLVGFIAAPLVMFGESLGDASEGFAGPSQWEPHVIAVPDYGPSTHEVLQSLRRRHSAGVDYPMAQAYGGCLVAQRCIEEAGTVDNYALRQAANALDFTTFYGRFSIDPVTGRQLGHDMIVIQWHRGKKRIVWPPEVVRES